jgi:hypothetical protein
MMHERASVYTLFLPIFLLRWTDRDSIVVDVHVRLRDSMPM